MVYRGGGGTEKKSVEIWNKHHEGWVPRAHCWDSPCCTGTKWQGRICAMGKSLLLFYGDGSLLLSCFPRTWYLFLMGRLGALWVNPPASLSHWHIWQVFTLWQVFMMPQKESSVLRLPWKYPHRHQYTHCDLSVLALGIESSALGLLSKRSPTELLSPALSALCILRYLIMLPRLGLNSLCSPGRSQTRYPPASDSLISGLTGLCQKALLSDFIYYLSIWNWVSHSPEWLTTQFIAKNDLDFVSSSKCQNHNHKAWFTKCRDQTHSFADVR